MSVTHENACMHLHACCIPGSTSRACLNKVTSPSVQVSPQICFFLQEKDGTFKPYAKLWLEQVPYQDDSAVVFEDGDLSKPLCRVRWTLVEVFVTLGLSEFIIDK